MNLIGNFKLKLNWLRGGLDIGTMKNTHSIKLSTYNELLTFLGQKIEFGSLSRLGVLVFNTEPVRVKSFWLIFVQSPKRPLDPRRNSWAENYT